jgi:hypothetical protein
MNATTKRQLTILDKMIHRNLDRSIFFITAARPCGVVWSPSGIDRSTAPDLLWSYDVEDTSEETPALQGFPCGSTGRIREITCTRYDRWTRTLLIVKRVKVYCSSSKEALIEAREIDLLYRFRYSGSAWTLAGVTMVGVPSTLTPSTNQANGLSI